MLELTLTDRILVVIYGYSCLLLGSRLIATRAKPSSGARFVLACSLGVQCCMLTQRMFKWPIWVTALFRSLAKEQGWYDIRYRTQIAILVSVCVLAIVILWWLVLVARSKPLGERILLLVLPLQLSLLMLYLVSWHPTNWLHRPIGWSISTAGWTEIGLASTTAVCVSFALAEDHHFPREDLI